MAAKKDEPSAPAGQLVKMDQARAALAACETVAEAEEIRDKADLYRRWVRQQIKKLAHASLEEAHSLRERAAAEERQAAELILRAEVRLGELVGEPPSPSERGSKGGRGKLSQATDSFLAQRGKCISIWRKVHSVAPVMDAYLARVDQETTTPPSRDGLLAYAKAVAKAAAVDEVAEDARGGDDGPKALGAPDAAASEPGAPRDGAERAAKALVQIAAQLAKDPLKGWPSVFLAGRDEAVLKIRDLAGWLANLSAEANEGAA